ncbi:3-mercaptopyruvate sulfurtransferase [Alphaproteobacteria bacterium]|nr:3-mercaptopyruvate sulfurtransferase [Alphaproteobacteria bacterium]
MSRTENLVTAEWLINNSKNTDLKICDATYFLVTHNRDAEAEYLAEHISGAIRFDIDAIKDTSYDLPHMLPTQQQFEDHMQKLGLRNNDIIVVYDNSPFLSSARAWWLLRMFGHKDVFVLDGGLKKFKAIGGKLETGTADNLPKSDYKASNPIDTNVILFKDLQSEIESQTPRQILDARSLARFKGIEPEPRAGLRSGHIPGSCNLPITSFLNIETGKIVSNAEILNILANAGVELDKPIITTCGSGVTATGLALALSLVGVRDVYVYDGSWAEWGSSSAPIETD